MPRKADPPAVRRAKGNTNRRPSATKERMAKAEKVAKIISQSFAAGEVETVPLLIADDLEAVSVWTGLAPLLAKTHRLQPQHRPMFAMFCQYYAQWVFARNHVRQHGLTIHVPTVASGGQVTMERRSPMLAVMDQAFRHCEALSESFGLTPADEWKLFKEQQAAASNNSFLFEREDGAKPAETTAAEQGSSRIGSLSSLDSKPPPLLN